MVTEAPTIFQHDPLPDKTWIRLVKVRSKLDPEEGIICCTLEKFNTNSNACPKYVALSYVWGDPTPTHTVYVNGRTRRVHKNLWQFLRRTWMNGAAEWFWTDLLCIDQAHHNEKNEQVGRMGDIYSRAKRTLAWLGEDEDASNALKVLDAYGSGTAESKRLLKSVNSVSASAAVHAQFRKARSRLIHREAYWERVWIFQEVVCARRCHVAYSDVTVDFEELLKQIRTVRSKLSLRQRRGYQKFFLPDAEVQFNLMYTLADLRDRLQAKEHLSFAHLLQKLFNCKSTRAVDRVYGLLGLASRLDPDFNLDALEINYDKSLRDVLWDVVFTTAESHSSRPLLTETLRLFIKELMGLRGGDLLTWEKVQGSLSGYASAATTSEKRRTHARAAERIFRSLTSDTHLNWKSSHEKAARQAFAHAVAHIQQSESDLQPTACGGLVALSLLKFSFLNPGPESESGSEPRPDELRSMPMPQSSHHRDGGPRLWCTAHPPEELRSERPKPVSEPYSTLLYHQLGRHCTAEPSTGACHDGLGTISMAEIGLMLCRIGTDLSARGLKPCTETRPMVRRLQWFCVRPDCARV